jgi:hypothetical protein
MGHPIGGRFVQMWATQSMNGTFDLFGRPELLLGLLFEEAEHIYADSNPIKVSVRRLQR